MEILTVQLQDSLEASSAQASISEFTHWHVDAGSRLTGSQSLLNAWLDTERQLHDQFNPLRISPIVALVLWSRNSPADARKRIRRLVSLGVRLPACDWNGYNNAIKE